MDDPRLSALREDTVGICGGTNEAVDGRRLTVAQVRLTNNGVLLSIALATITSHLSIGGYGSVAVCLLLWTHFHKVQLVLAYVETLISGRFVTVATRHVAFCVAEVGTAAQTPTEVIAGIQEGIAHRHVAQSGICG